jgi:type II secretory pathway pseudopilin PulG
MILPPPRRLRSFTLVEVVIVIALIVLLSALVLGIGTAVVKSSENRQTALTLTQLDTAAREWRLQADRDIEIPQPQAADLVNLENPDTDPELVLYLNRYFHLLQRPAALKEMLSKLDSSFVTRRTYLDPAEPGHQPETIRVIDAWDTPVLVVSCGRLWVQGTDAPADRDADGTIKTDLERRLGFAPNRQPYFVSAGPDRRFGDVSATGDDFEATRDNIYSPTPEFP